MSSEILNNLQEKMDEVEKDLNIERDKLWNMEHDFKLFVVFAETFDVTEIQNKLVEVKAQKEKVILKNNELDSLVYKYIELADFFRKCCVTEQ